jgi:3-oxoacyl-[acyl-carrier protein] reductase
LQIPKLLEDLRSTPANARAFGMAIWSFVCAHENKSLGFGHDEIHPTPRVESRIVELGLRGRSAAVAAASKGLGRAVAIALAQEGVDVAVCARTAEDVRTVEAELQASGVRTLGLPLDVTDPDAPGAFIEAAVEAFGRLDIVFSNVGGPPTGSFDSFSLPDYEAAVNSNLMTHIRMCLAAVPHMRRAKWGRILVLGSLTMKQPLEGLILSTSARSGVAGFAKSLADEVAADGITVNCICPGRILTDRIRSLAETRAQRTGESFDSSLRMFERDIPMRRIGQPEELAALAVFLASERASYITGTSIQVDGGLTRSLT